MAPQFMSGMGKKLRRKTRMPFFSSLATNTTDGSSSDGGDASATSSGSLTPPPNPNSETALDELIRTAPGASTVVSTQYPRPPLRGSGSSVLSRYSSSASMSGRKPKAACSPYAPWISNVHENTRVCQKVLLLQGTVGEGSSLAKIDGTVTVTRLDDSFPPTKWPVTESHFKALVYLNPGPNRLQFEFSSPKLSTNGPASAHLSFLTVVMVPATNVPPLQLAIVLAKDSPETFDVAPAMKEKEGDGLETAIKRFRMAAYLWQAFTADQMGVNKLGRRTFRFEEEWTTGTASSTDLENAVMRSEARVHVFRLDKTVRRLRAMDRHLAHMRDMEGNVAASDIFAEVADAVRKGLRPLAGQKHYVAAMLLDSHWDSRLKHVGGHVSAGGSSGDLGLALFGSHCLHSYPGSIQEVVPSFTDCTPTDGRHTFNDDGEAGRLWEVANFGIGGHLKQIGRMFGCQSQESGIMADGSDHLLLSRSFVSREAFSTRTNSKGGLVRVKDQPRWHRLDCLRFLHHPCFRFPGQQPARADASIQAWPVGGGNLAVTAPSGIAFVEMFVGDQKCCSSWEEYLSDSAAAVTRQVTLNELSLKMRLSEPKLRGPLRVRITSCSGGHLEIPDFRETVSGETASLALETGKVVFRSKALGDGSSVRHGVDDDTPPEDAVWFSAAAEERSLSSIHVYHDGAICGVEFALDNGSRQLLGTKGQEGQAVIGTFQLDVGRGEQVSSVFARAEPRINALQFATNLGRQSPLFGGRLDGKPQTWSPPRGFTICGVSGKSTTFGDAVPGLESLSVLISR